MRLFTRVNERAYDPRWTWSLARDGDGLVHWRMHYPNTQDTRPLCYAVTGRLGVVPARRSTHPTCVHCILVPMKPIAS